MQSIKITGLKYKDKKILAIKLLRNHLTENDNGRGLIGLKEAKDIVDAMYLDQFPERLYVFNTLTNEFKSMFRYVERPPLRLYKVLVELDTPLPATLHEVLVLSIGANSARVVALDSLTVKHSASGHVRNVRLVSEFKNNTILASYKVTGSAPHA